MGSMHVFLAGATGAIGRRLVGLLLQSGHTVTGMTRFAGKAAQLEASGVAPAVVDAFDAKALTHAVARARPDVVIHQLTDLPQVPDPALMATALERNARLRTEGTRNLVNAALAAGATRLIVQSIAFAYAPGAEPHHEDDPLDLESEGSRGITVQAVSVLEHLATATAGIDGIVLRYGRLYGPGTWSVSAAGRTPVHVDAAASAAALAVTRGEPGIYNVAEPDGSVSVSRACRELGWDPDFRMPAG